MIREAEIIDQLARSKVYRDFVRAFCEATELPVRLRSLEKWKLTSDAQRSEQQFLDVTAVPVRLGDKIIGVLETGQAASADPAEGAKNLETQIQGFRASDGMHNGLSRSRYEAMVHLLQIFAQQLSFFANQIMIKQDESEPYRVRLARTFISRHQAENINLADVARVTHVSTFHLCKIFKKATGLTFIEYRNRLRIESAKRLLGNPNLNVSEIAYSVGFQSLTQFNRLFRRVVGRAPTDFRSNLAEESAPLRAAEIGVAA